jgi:prephenate dehydratase/prephenate dehydrogenase
MKTIVTLGPEKSLCWQAAHMYDADAEIVLYPHLNLMLEAFADGRGDFAVVPVYNTRQGGNKQYFRSFELVKDGYWIDNIILHTNLSLGVFDPQDRVADLQVLIGKRFIFKQCEEYIDANLPETNLLNVRNVDQAIAGEQQEERRCRGVIDTADKLKAHGLHVVEQDVAPHNRTRFAVIGRELAKPTGFDATTFVTEPLADRVGLLVDILSEFSCRGINLIDLHTENDIKSQKLRIYIEAEGHIDTASMDRAIKHIEDKVIQQPNCIRLLGSFPRVEMRTKLIKSFGFIGTGAMSTWFADQLKSEGYEVLLSGRSTILRPEEMIKKADVICICVPISVTSTTIRKYGALLEAGQALVLLVGEAEHTINTALESTDESVEVMLVHNLWGPQADNMKDKNAIVVRTRRSSVLCSEFEAFLYKHGANIFHDSPLKHDLLMGVGQKLPTVISVALAMTLGEHEVANEDISSHCTLTSLYSVLAMVRVHTQNPRTYAEIMSTTGYSWKIVHDFARNLETIIKMAKNASIPELCSLMDENTQHLSDDFLRSYMQQTKAIDELLAKIIYM